MLEELRGNWEGGGGGAWIENILCENFEEKYFYKTNDILSVEATFHSILKCCETGSCTPAGLQLTTYFHSKLLPLQGFNLLSGIYGARV